MPPHPSPSSPPPPSPPPRPPPSPPSPPDAPPSVSDDDGPLDGDPSPIAQGAKSPSLAMMMLIVFASILGILVACIAVGIYKRVRRDQEGAQKPAVRPRWRSSLDGIIGAERLDRWIDGRTDESFRSDDLFNVSDTSSLWQVASPLPCVRRPTTSCDGNQTGTVHARIDAMSHPLTRRCGRGCSMATSRAPRTMDSSTYPSQATTSKRPAARATQRMQCSSGWPRATRRARHPARGRGRRTARWPARSATATARSRRARAHGLGSGRGCRSRRNSAMIRGPSAPAGWRRWKMIRYQPPPRARRTPRRLSRAHLRSSRHRRPPRPRRARRRVHRRRPSLRQPLPRRPRPRRRRRSGLCRGSSLRLRLLPMLRPRPRRKRLRSRAGRGRNRRLRPRLLPSRCSRHRLLPLGRQRLRRSQLSRPCLRRLRRLIA